MSPSCTTDSLRVVNGRRRCTDPLCDLFDQPV